MFRMHAKPALVPFATTALTELALVGLSLAALTGPSSAQSFVLNTADIPQTPPANNSSTENVDFGDVDLDGDWDAIFADGGDDGNDQNRIWINQGGLQVGTVGVFEDDTDARFPSGQDDSRDIEFSDYDADGDLDVYVSNSAQLSNQGSRFWTNGGGLQGAGLGFYADDTASRWLGLGQAGSSIPAAMLVSGTFIDWSCDSDFADLDNDGFADLVQSSYGGAFGGNVPTRVFLNDGDGRFAEFNPSGFQLAGANISNGDPGLWCEGTQTANTTDATGAQCDIATDGLDVEFADTDGDLDLDFVNGGRNTQPRLFQNRLEENGQSLGFRDFTTAGFPPDWSIGGANFEQELGDLDNDDDLDLHGLNWQTAGFAFQDALLENGGNGVFNELHVLPGSDEDANEGDLFDYDNDGDLDIYIANFSGSNKLHRNELNLGTPFDFTDVSSEELPALPTTVTLDADMADVDNDGDYDVFEATDNFSANRYLENVSQVADAVAPRLERLEAVSGHSASAMDDSARVQVYDNAPYYVTYYNETHLEVRVDGVALPQRPMVSSGGQIFRGELPGNLVGPVEYRAVSQDQYGNAGASSTGSYTNTGPTGTLQGGTTPTPMGTPTLRGLTAPIAGQPVFLAAAGASPGAQGVFLFSFAEIAGGVFLGDGVFLNVLPPLIGAPVPGSVDSSGNMLFALETTSLSLSGATVHAQALLADGDAGATWASTQSLALSFP